MLQDMRNRKWYSLKHIPSLITFKIQVGKELPIFFSFSWSFLLQNIPNVNKLHVMQFKFLKTKALKSIIGGAFLCLGNQHDKKSWTENQK